MIDIKTLLSNNYFGNSGNNILIAVEIFIGLFLALWIFKTYILHKITKLAKKTKNEIDDIILDIIEQIGWQFYFFISLYFSLTYLKFSQLFDEILSKMLIIFVAYYVVKSINIIIDYLTQKQVTKSDKDDDSLALVLNTLIKIIIAIIGFLFVLSNLGINVASLIAGVGVGGIAIAFALQSILEDIFSSFSIYFDKPFEVGDFIIIGDDLGVVKHIGLKTTRITHLKGQELVVSNSELTNTRINNYKKMKKRRINFGFGVEYGTPVSKLNKINAIMAKAVNLQKYAELDRSHFKDFGDFSLNFDVVYYLDSSDYNVYMDTQQAINLELVKQFEKEKIGFAFPTQTIHIKK